MQLEKPRLEEHETREINKEALLAAKDRLENELRRLEKKELNDHTRSLLQGLNELTAALATMQDMLNLVWKRSEQMQEELGALRSKTE